MSDWTNVANEGRIELLENAKESLDLAIKDIEDALRGTEWQPHADAYIIGHLRSWIDAINPGDMGVQQYIDSIKRLDEKGEDS